MTIHDRVPVLCLFCNAPLQGNPETKYHSGDLIKCLECGEENDFDSVVLVAKESAIQAVKKALFKGKI